MSLLPVSEARNRLLTDIAIMPNERIGLADALGRVLGTDLRAHRDQPPFPASAMDGYALKAADAGRVGATLFVKGVSRAGERFGGDVEPGEAVRIFTGAPVPPGADAILIQENAERIDDQLTVLETVKPGQFLRPQGLDFAKGDVMASAGIELNPRTLALAASLNNNMLDVRKKPQIAVLSTGDELVPPGGSPSDDQIISSNAIGIAALSAQAGGSAVDLGIATDTIEAIQTSVKRADGANILVIAGGASVGEHDLVQEALTGLGMELDFWKIAMRPGKPLMVGRLGDMRVLGLPGNPVSALVCSTIFLTPLIRAFLGLTSDIPIESARLAGPLPANDQREDYMRARFVNGTNGPVVEAFKRQDSSMLATLAASDALIIRPPFSSPVSTNDSVPIIRLGK